MKRAATLALFAVLVLAHSTMAAEASRPGPGSTVVLLPFENLTGSGEAERDAWQLFADALVTRGWRVAERAQVETILERERVRYFDSVDAPVRLKLVEELQAGAIVSGAIYTYAEGRNPVVALSARMVRADGTLGWGDVAGISAEDTERVLGFGRDEKRELLLRRVVATMMKRFPAPGSEGAPVRGRSAPLFLPRAVSYRAADVDPMQPHNVCILPFDNDTLTPWAARLVADVLAVRLAAASGFEVVEPAVLRAAAAKAGIGTFYNISSEELARLSTAVGTPLFLKGTIFEFEDPAAHPGATPVLQLELTLVDVDQSRVVWSAQHMRDGSDYTGFLMLGAVTNSVSLADRVLTEVIDAGTRRAPRGEAAVTARVRRHGPEKHSALRKKADKDEKN